ncbi:histidine kinase [Streptomyces sp. NPDC051162]|uniref:sensor histidine kinase n=1 Tax=Streptomyces sp. NPDC051162 TaxID=3154747 RepID=UPI0034464DF9
MNSERAQDMIQPDAAYPWLLPSAVMEPRAGGGRARRTARDWAVDIVCLAFAALFGLLVADDARASAQVSDGALLADQIVGAAACTALWLRRRWPTELAVALAAVSAVTPCAAGALLVAVFSVAVHRPFRAVAVAGGLALASQPVQAIVRPDPGLGFMGASAIGMLLVLTMIGWGMFVRSRRQLVLSLRERAVRAEAEAELRAERAQRLARESIAREMHDVLAHRLSLLCVHAGALEYRPDAPPAELARATGVIRSSAHQALQDLREVIGVLRAPESAAASEGTPGAGSGPDADRPQPTLAALEELLEESRQAGMAVRLDQKVADPLRVPAATGRTVYRIVQEALTNARKHAPGAEVGVVVGGSPAEGLTVVVTNPPGSVEAAAVPGSGQGLIGLTERATLAGGRLEHGPAPDGGFRVRGWLPWPV